MSLVKEFKQLSCGEKAVLIVVGILGLTSILFVRSCDAVRDWCKADPNKVAVMDLVGSDEYDEDEHLDTLTAEEGSHLVKALRNPKPQIDPLRRHKAS